jgi:hypothetical protein
MHPIIFSHSGTANQDIPFEVYGLAGKLLERQDILG